jgi:hypothetical protein
MAPDDAPNGTHKTFYESDVSKMGPQERQWGGLAPQFRPHSSCHTALNYVRMKMEHVS